MNIRLRGIGDILPITTVFGRAGGYGGGVPSVVSGSLITAPGAEPIDFSFLGGPSHLDADVIAAPEADKVAAVERAGDWSGDNAAGIPPDTGRDDSNDLILNLGRRHGLVRDFPRGELPFDTWRRKGRPLQRGRGCGLAAWSDTLQDIAKQAAGAAGGYLTPEGTLIQKTASGELIYRQPSDNPNNLAVGGGLFNVTSQANAGGAALVIGGVAVAGLVLFMVARRK